MVSHHHGHDGEMSGMGQHGGHSLLHDDRGVGSSSVPRANNSGRVLSEGVGIGIPLGVLGGAVAAGNVAGTTVGGSCWV